MLHLRSCFSLSGTDMRTHCPGFPHFPVQTQLKHALLRELQIFFISQSKSISSAATLDCSETSTRVLTGKPTQGIASLTWVLHYSQKWPPDETFALLQIWPPDGVTCITYNICHQMAPFALVANLTTRWRHLHRLQIWPPDGGTCISCKFGHQMAPLA